MDTGPHAPLPPEGDLAGLAPDDPRVLALLERWDELPDARRAALEGQPTIAARLARLQEAERWLGRGLARRRAAEARRPSAEDLFDSSQAPGRRPLPLDRRRAVERHLADDTVEAAWVESLARRPPATLLVEPLAEDDPARATGLADDDPARRRRITPWVSRWMPLAAAAAVLTFGVVQVRENRELDVRPLATLLRGAPGEPLQFPRGRVLAAPEDSVGLFASRPHYDITPVAGAGSYRVELRTAGADAFSVGEVLWAAEGPGPSFEGEPLAPGAYTWEAWATVNGLERPLGALEFRVVEDAERLQQLARLPLDEQVRQLLAGGWRTDARHRARLLPANGDAREALDAAPAR